MIDVVSPLPATNRISERGKKSPLKIKAVPTGMRKMPSTPAKKSIARISKDRNSGSTNRKSTGRSKISSGFETSKISEEDDIPAFHFAGLEKRADAPGPDPAFFHTKNTKDFKMNLMKQKMEKESNEKLRHLPLNLIRETSMVVRNQRNEIRESVAKRIL